MPCICFRGHISHHGTTTTEVEPQLESKRDREEAFRNKVGFINYAEPEVEMVDGGDGGPVLLPR